MTTEERDAERRAEDRAWLALEAEPDGGHAHVELAERHVTPLGRLYGGAALCFVAALIEAAAARRLRWATVQFISPAEHGDRLDLHTEVLAAGHRTAQVRVLATSGGRTVLHGIGAAAHDNPKIPGGTPLTAPVVPAPAECPPLPLPVFPAPRLGFLSLSEARDASGSGVMPVVGAGDTWPRRWVRYDGCAISRPALMAMVADVVPGPLMQAVGELGTGTSLDNTIRVGSAPDSEWLLADVVAEHVSDGFGHGSVHLWTPDGALAGTGSQTAALWRFEDRVT